MAAVIEMCVLGSRKNHVYVCLCLMLLVVEQLSLSCRPLQCRCGLTAHCIAAVFHTCWLVLWLLYERGIGLWCMQEIENAIICYQKTAGVVADIAPKAGVLATAGQRSVMENTPETLRSLNCLLPLLLSPHSTCPVSLPGVLTFSPCVSPTLHVRCAA